MGKEQDPGSEQGGTPEQAELQAPPDEAGKTVPRRAGKRGLVARLRPLHERRWMIVAASAVALVVAGLAFFPGDEGTGGRHPRQAPPSRERALQDGLRQDELPRFYIPLPQTSQNRVAVVDFSVVWDALSAVRFKKIESQVRDRLYAFMLGTAGKGEDLQDKVSLLEAEMDRIFRESLRTENVAVKVREIRSY
ncbi:MAG: hypothetical protein AB1512_28565 [Thermodesulfobacteriota bacterium]